MGFGQQPLADFWRLLGMARCWQMRSDDQLTVVVKRDASAEGRGVLKTDNDEAPGFVVKDGR